MFLKTINASNTMKNKYQQQWKKVVRKRVVRHIQHNVEVHKLNVMTPVVAKHLEEDAS